MEEHLGRLRGSSTAASSELQPDPDQASTSSQQSSAPPPQGFVRHQVQKSDNLAGLAIRYNVTVSDIKRANGLLSDSGMFAKDTLLIPTQALAIGEEYATWASMIVTQFGRIPGSGNPASVGITGFSSSPERHVSPAMGHLQHYYQVNDPDPDLEMHPGMGSQGGSPMRGGSGDVQMTPLSSGPSEYAGSRAGKVHDERLRRRKAADEAGPSESYGLPVSVSASDGREGVTAYRGPTSTPPRPPSGSAFGGGLTAGLGSLVRGNSGSGGSSSSHRRNLTGPSNSAQKESIFEKIKRVASQPALAGPPAPPLTSMGEGAFLDGPASTGSMPSSDDGLSTVKRIASAVQLKRDKERCE